MAIDSREKRQSISGIPGPPLIPGVTPNASPDFEWRREAGWNYAESEIPTPTPSPTPSAPYGFDTVDPLTQVYKSIWSILEAESSFTDLVKPGNRIKYFDKTQPEKKEAQYADTPEVELLPIPMEMNIPNTNLHSRLTADYELIIRSGSNRLNAQLFPLEWVITKILFSAADENFSTKATAAGVVWNMTYVRKFRIMDGNPTNTDIELTRGKRSWCTRMQLQAVWDIHRAKMNA